MQYHFSAVKAEDRRWTVATVVVIFVLLGFAGAVYFTSPRFARITVPTQEIQIPVGTSASVTVEVENLSRDTYSSVQRIMLSGRYVGRDRALPQLDRFDLGQLSADSRKAYEVTVASPGQPGRYRLQLDLIREGSSWFADLGNPAPVVEVVVP